MSQVNRLTSGGRIDRTRKINFTFNGKTLEGFAGDTLASALIANGIDVVNRSFKYSRPRGIVAAGAEEPNAVVQLGSAEQEQIPNVRATQQALYQGLVAASTNGWPNVDRDLMGVVGKIGGRFMPPGFYYKTFKQPASMWKTYEKYIRKGAGLGRSPTLADPDIYDHFNQHCDVLVIGAGAAGLAAALTAGRSGVSVIVVDEQEEMGGSLLDSREIIDEKAAALWVSKVLNELQTLPNVQLLAKTTANGYHDHNFITLIERRTDHLSITAPQKNGHKQARQRMHRVRAGRVVLATGAHERPLVYSGNDIPGNYLASAVSTYIHRYGVVPGNKLVVSTSNDDGYRAALDWLESGREVVAIADARSAPEGELVKQAKLKGIRIITGSAVMEAQGSTRVRSVEIARINVEDFRVVGSASRFACDTVASSGGFSPVLHLSSHCGGRPQWHDEILGFVPAQVKGMIAVGGAQGIYSLPEVLRSGFEAGNRAAVEMGASSQTFALPQSRARRDGSAIALYQVPHLKSTMRAPKQFVDLQNDVTSASIELATREGFESIEHIKRYTVMGFGTDQGKLGNINGLAIAARVLKRTIPDVGTTVFRPNYTPVTFGAITGRHCNELFQPERYTALHQWHVEHGAMFEDVGQWKRPWYFPQRVKGQLETMHQAVVRECRAVRESVGVLDASTLGKIDIQGPDAREFLERVYTNKWAKLPVGRVRYGLMCRDDGMVFDDGTTSCLGQNHFLMTTSTGNAATVLEWLELWHQTEWPELQVYFTSVTDHWATITLTGPKARELLAEFCDIDLARDSFKFMDWREGKVADVPARVFRISFTGELAYEINVQANYALHVWRVLFEHGAKYNLTPYGTETMHVLRAEKGFIIGGQDTDGSMTPHDLGMEWCVGNDKPFSWIGKRSHSRSDVLREDRKQLVGLLPKDPTVVLEEGAQVVFDPHHAVPIPMYGHVTSSYYSPTLDSGFALAVVTRGHHRMGESVWLASSDGKFTEAEIVSSIFVDPKGERQNV
ncbi:sarcosine oxidase subunit alpha family protein [Pantoea sp. Acro-805]|uniref:Sarcosine oxidase subunit alpha family protein n=1 Tax=Candidatus Pantoea formicae TaxID=2608355 RepID=A0ABX0QTE0_9GAMM|nr:sarcosine oxidase subunit alpha family protein [Pantoea formicae]MDF7652023.1 sarcosine oxidase subunit alpha family protein [Erwiniaceae bacterium L1_54_3]NIE99143.1 sarcosine oxidase subunit alpha family protein [Pantoea formicae]